MRSYFLNRLLSMKYNLSYFQSNTLGYVQVTISNGFSMVCSTNAVCNSYFQVGQLTFPLLLQVHRVDLIQRLGFCHASISGKSVIPIISVF
ncbi:rCG59087 [Rattus norvegicus]|uniref:RCG59087 n=1 Tax=Rattus norvegicus TaxID=10116 RepID=A6JPI7_RAT|nr:rCG59087 [Rattus norvegicus]